MERNADNIFPPIGGYLGLGILFLFLAFLFGWPQIISPGEAAVVTRFGSIVGTRDNGFYIEPLAGWTYYDVKTLKIESEEAAATKDLQDINLKIALNFRIDRSQIETYFETVGNQDDILNKLIRPRVSQNTKSVTTRYAAEEILTNRDQIKSEILELMKADLQAQGLVLEELSITNIVFPNPEFNAAIDAKQIAEQKVLELQYELEQTKLEAQKQEVQKESLTDKILTKLFIEKWNGQLPQYMGDEFSFLLPK